MISEGDFCLLRYCFSLLAVIFGSGLIAAGFNLFLIPHRLLSGGVSGLSMLASYFTLLNVSLLYLLFNIPLLVAGWFQLGRRFIVFSIASVAATTWLIEIIPVKMLVSDMLLASVFGGVLVGVGSGNSFRVGGSSGGFDILGSIISRHRDFPIGSVLVSLNALVILAAGYLENNWNIALASMASMYVTGRVVDLIHVSHIKVTVLIVTSRTDEMLQHLLELQRGVTKIKTEGAYSHTEKDMLMTVTTRYELAELKRIIKQSDPQAFVNILETVGIMGSFRKR